MHAGLYTYKDMASMIIANNIHGLVSKKLKFLNKNNKELNYDVSKSRGLRTCMLMWVVVGKGLGVGVSASSISSSKRTYCWVNFLVNLSFG